MWWAMRSVIMCTVRWGRSSAHPILLLWQGAADGDKYDKGPLSAAAVGALVKNCTAWWWSEQKAADTERSMRRGWQPRFQNSDMTYNIQQFWLSRDALVPYKSPQSIYLSTPLSSYSILFYWVEEEESSLSRISLVWQCSLEKQAEPLL